ncbi:MAG: TRAP transporter small permease [Hyphomicrobiales bacterium]|nr:TRAP transporter small permease [Hyphomicrobiales bacterium]
MLGRIIEHLEEGIISLLLVSMTLIVFIEVVLRFGFSIGFLWVDELTLHLSAWLVLFGMSYGVKVGSHIGVDAIVRLLSTNVRRIVTLIALVLCLVYCGLFIEGAWVYLVKVHKIGIDMEDLPIPKYVAHSILLLGFVLLAFRFLQLGWKVLTGKVDGFNLADEAKEALDEVRHGQEPAQSGGK